MRVPTIFLTVDAVIFKTIKNAMHVLLIQRKNAPYQNAWALPGGFVDKDEDLNEAVKRELFEETNLRIDDLQQLKAYGKPFRDPRGHVVSIAFYGFANENDEPIADDDAAAAQWFLLNELPEMAFDHQEILSFAMTKI